MPLLMLLCDFLLPRYPRTLAENSFSLYRANCSCSHEAGMLVDRADELSPCSMKLPLTSIINVSVTKIGVLDPSYLLRSVSEPTSLPTTEGGCTGYRLDSSPYVASATALNSLPT